MVRGAGLAMPLLAAAQQPPSEAEVRESAQEAQRQQERERTLREQRERSPEVSLLRPQAPADGDDNRPDLPCFPIRRVALKGDDVVAQFSFLARCWRPCSQAPIPCAWVHAASTA